ncbi:hypothetical protein BDQ17DRAFT_1360183, partial [Cyathus striatus]
WWFSFYPSVFLPVTHSFSLFHLFVYFVYTLPLPLFLLHSIHYTLIFLVLCLFLVPVPLLVHVPALVPIPPSQRRLMRPLKTFPSSSRSLLIYLPVPQTPCKVSFIRPPHISTLCRTLSSFRIESLCVAGEERKHPTAHHNIKYLVRFRPGVQLVETKLRLIVLPPANDSETHHVVSNTMESTDSLTLRREAMVEWCSTARISELHCSR